MSEALSDEKLYLLCKEFGARVLEYRRKFLGLLPEVNKRELAERKAGGSWLRRRGFSSVFEFAAKLAGVSEEQVRLVLNLERKFDDKPELKKLLIRGEVSVNKLARVASIANSENQSELAEKVLVLPKAALDCLVRDERSREREVTSGAGVMSVFDAVGDERVGPARRAGLPVHSKVSGIDKDVKLMGELSEELKSRLLVLAGKGIDVDQLLTEFLDKRELEIEERKSELGLIEQERTVVAPGLTVAARGRSRYISVKIRKVLNDEFGSKCAIAGCVSQAEAVHHTNRFSLARNHNPRFLAPLCAGHHQLAHLADARFARRMRHGDRGGP